jgi:hypothetical protein
MAVQAVFRQICVARRTCSTSGTLIAWTGKLRSSYWLQCWVCERSLRHLRMARMAARAHSHAIELSVVGEQSAMLGWHISVYRQKNGGLSPATAETTHGSRLAAGQTGVGGLDWLDELVKAGKAINLGENGGYPCRYTAIAECLIPRIIGTPPGARARWALASGDYCQRKIGGQNGGKPRWSRCLSSERMAPRRGVGRKLRSTADLLLWPYRRFYVVKQTGRAEIRRGWRGGDRRGSSRCRRCCAVVLRPRTTTSARTDLRRLTSAP